MDAFQTLEAERLTIIKGYFGLCAPNITAFPGASLMMNTAESIFNCDEQKTLGLLISVFPNKLLQTEVFCVIGLSSVS